MNPSIVSFLKPQNSSHPPPLPPSPSPLCTPSYFLLSFTMSLYPSLWSSLRSIVMQPPFFSSTKTHCFLASLHYFDMILTFFMVISNSQKTQNGGTIIKLLELPKVAYYSHPYLTHFGKFFHIIFMSNN